MSDNSNLSKQSGFELNLEQSEKKFRQIFQNATIGIGIADMYGRIIEFNDAMLQPGNYTRDDILSLDNIADLYYNPDDRNRLLTLAKNHGFISEAPVQFKRKDGSPYDTLLSLKPITIDAKPCWQAIVQDVTVQKKNEDYIRKMNELNVSLLYSGNLKKQLKLITDGVVSIFNADFARIWLTKNGDLCDSGCIHATATEELHICKNKNMCLHLMSSSGRYTHIDGDHKRVPFGCYKIGLIAADKENGFFTNNAVEDPRVHNHAWIRKIGLKSFAGYRLLEESGMPIGVLALFSKKKLSSLAIHQIENLANLSSQVIQKAITEEKLQETIKNLKQIEGELKSSEERYHSLIHTMNEGLVEVDKDWIVTFVNKCFADMVRCPRRQIVGKKFSNFVTKNYKGKVQEEHQNRLKGILSKYELELLRSDKTEIPVFCSPHPFYDNDGKYIGGVGIITDITEIKQHELTKLEKEKLKTLVEIAGAVCHEFNQPLQAISGSCELLKLMDKPEDEKNELYKTIFEQIHRIKKLNHKLAHVTKYKRKNYLETKIIDILESSKE